MEENNYTAFEVFCGGGFWNSSLSWDTGNETFPDLTPCMQNTVVIWAPCVLLWITLPIYITFLNKRSQKVDYVQDLSVISLTKSCLSLAMAIVSLITLINASVRADMTKAVYVSSTVTTISMILTAWLVQKYRISGQYTSGVLWLYWTLWMIGSALALYSRTYHAYQAGRIADVMDFTITSLNFCISAFQFMLACMSDASQKARDKTKNLCPEPFVSFPNYFLISWIFPVLAVGYKKRETSLTKEDLWNLNYKDRPENHVPPFQLDWENSLETWRTSERMDVQRNGSINQSDVEPDDTTPLIRQPVKEKEKSLPSLLKILSKHYIYLLLGSWCFEVVGIATTYISPQIQKQLIQFVASRSVVTAKSSPLWQGYALCVGMLIVKIINATTSEHYWYLGVKLSHVFIRPSLISLVYRKVLQMSGQARKESTVGEIVNLMAVDVDRLSNFIIYCSALWAQPIYIVIAIWQLYLLVGPSVFAGFGTMVLMLPINAWVATRQEKLQAIQMKLKDERIKLMSEVLSSIKVIKLYAWEPSFEDKVTAIREKEVAVIRKAAYYRAFQIFGFEIIPFVVTVVTFAVYVSLDKNHILRPEIAFVALTLFSIMGGPLAWIPIVISDFAMASVSVKRLVKFLCGPDLDTNNVQRLNLSAPGDSSIYITNGTFSWVANSNPVLKNISMDVPTNSLTAVVGPVGCGKSSLLAACIGDMYKNSGLVQVKGSVAYSAQQAWIQNATVRDNITFGSEFEQERYDQVVEACALKPDFLVLRNGDMSVIGEKGINLSGGQKQRVSLARAVYSQADVYILDDPLSAVDAHVGKHIFDEVIGPQGLLQHKTRVLVTHGVRWLPQTDNIVVMQNGAISERGSYDQLLQHNGAFAQFLKTYFLSGENDSDSDDENESVNQTRSSMLKRLESVTHDDCDNDDECEESLTEIVLKLKTQRQLSRGSRHSESEAAEKNMTVKNTDDDKKESASGEIQAFDEETMEQGKVSYAVYLTYIKSVGYGFAAATVLQLTLEAGGNVFSSIWLSKWTGDPVFFSNSTAQEKQTAMNMYLSVYGGLGFVRALLTLGYAFALAQCMIRASLVLHKHLLSNILKAKMSFFDIKPLGQILNRFSKDMDTIDNDLGFSLQDTFSNMLSILTTVVVIGYSTPIFLVAVLPLFIYYYFVQKFFVPTVRQLRRLESVSKSPIYTQFSETINGVQSIRAYGHQTRFEKKSTDLVQTFFSYLYPSLCCYNWLAIRLEGMSAIIVFLASLFCVLSTQINYLHSHITASLTGLAITYALTLSQSTAQFVRALSNLETNSVSIERVKEYSETETEADWRIQQYNLPSNWPEKGAIKFNQYAARYRDGLDLVLKGITFDIGPREKIGIVGRTGAGKSSMTLALFRLIEASQGSIEIDGQNIATLGLHELRSKITILPQDPVLFAGSIRANLDPFDIYGDDRLWVVLEQSSLKTFVSEQPDGLSYDCGEGGTNLSVGQKQLVCLARALLRKTRILVLDEATAAVDMETDDLLQKTIREAFADCTVLTIAHRLNTIIDSDRILVLDNGEVAEFKSPGELMADENSQFYSMAKDAGIIKSG